MAKTQIFASEELQSSGEDRPIKRWVVISLYRGFLSRQNRVLRERRTELVARGRWAHSGRPSRASPRTALSPLFPQGCEHKDCFSRACVSASEGLFSFQAPLLLFLVSSPLRPCQSPGSREHTQLRLGGFLAKWLFRGVGSFLWVVRDADAHGPCPPERQRLRKTRGVGAQVRAGVLGGGPHDGACDCRGTCRCQARPAPEGWQRWHPHLPFLQASKSLTGYPRATPSGGARGAGACEVVPWGQPPRAHSRAPCGTSALTEITHTLSFLLTGLPTGPHARHWGMKAQ